MNERAAYMEYSLPYLPQPTVIVVEKGKEFPFGRWESLMGKKGVSNIGESYGQEFDAFIKSKLDVQFIAFERALELLNRGEVDYLIVDLYTALIYARLLQGEDAITLLEPPVTTQAFSSLQLPKTPRWQYRCRLLIKTLPTGKGRNRRKTFLLNILKTGNTYC